MDISRHLMSLVLLAFILATFFSTALTRHRIRHHRDRFKRQQGAHLFLPGSYVTDGGSGPDAGPWGDWGPPSSCSRTCGGGVSTQERVCQQEEACRGPARKHFSCNTQDCPDDEDYRAQQCAEFNRVPFEGIYYHWIPYTKAANPCELNCMPRGERFYYRHKKSVADGTRCNAEELDVCVGGKCQPVGCDMMLGSNAREDKCRQCGGNGTTCRTVTGTLDMQDLQVGYNDILLIPAGATNIAVREIAPSNNYLAIRNVTGHYYLNGNWRIDFPKTLKFAGANFHYERSPQGFAAPDTIICLGPTFEPLFAVLLYQDTNVGVHYEYSVPKGISQNLDPDTYAWIFEEFGPCSASCGGGFQTRNVSCAGRRTLEIVEKSLCDAASEPASSQMCGDQPCEPEWVESPWSECSDICGEDGVQTREVHCERLVSRGLSSIVNDQQCVERLGQKPDVKQACNQGIPCPMWHTGPWKPCDRLCGKGKEVRKVTCYRKVDGQIEVLDDSLCEAKEKKPESQKSCSLRPCEGLDWVASDWSGCDNKCGLANETRKVHCATQKGEVYPDELCEGEQKPDLIRECETSKSCDHEWYTSQWSECSAKCGTGVQTRRVFCATFEDDSLKKVQDDKCDPSKKYDGIKNCTAEETVCSGEWFSGPWTKCDKECGGGTKSRKVICMKDEKVVSADNCDPNTVAFSSETCNMNPCGDDQILPVNTTKPVEEKEKEDKEKAMGEPDEDVEEIDDPECLDGEWVYEDYDKLEPFARLVEIFTSESSAAGSSYSTETSWVSEDLMLSDATDYTDESSDLDTPEGSGAFTSSLDGSTLVSLSSESSIISSEGTISSAITDSSSDSTVEGSGESADTESTGSDVTSESSDKITSTLEYTASSDTDSSESTTKASSETDVDASAVTTEVSPESTDSSSDSTDTDASTLATDVSLTSSDATSVTEDVSTIESTDSSPEDTGASSVSTDASPVTDDTSDDSTELTTGLTTESTVDSTSSDDSTESSSDSTVSSSSESDSSTSPTDTTSPTSEESSPDTESTLVTETTTSESTPSTDATSSDTSELTTVSSVDITTVASTDVSTEISSDQVTTVAAETSTEELFIGESNVGAEESVKFTEEKEIEPTAVSTEASTADSSLSSEESTTISSETEETTDTSSDMTTVSGLTTASDELETSSTTDITTVSHISISTDLTTSSEITPSDISISTDLTTSSDIIPSDLSKETDISSTVEMTEPSLSTSSDITTETGVPTEFESSTTEGTTSSDISTVSSITSETTTAGLSSSTESTPFDIWSTTETGLSTESTVTDLWGTTPYTLEAVTMRKVKKCVRRKKEGCKYTPFGCCYDMITPAQGPFDKGCPTPKTCVETNYGCCEDGVTPAAGPNYKDCPPSLCMETLFGCCPDNTTVAEGNNFEGCKKEPLPPECLTSEFGCCEDNITAATGPDKQGCKECEKSEFGCCPDGVSAAIGENYDGCELEITTKAPLVEEIDCSNSTFGCCPDGQTIAEGEYFQGCGIINEANCTLSYFGCCPDGESPALGPQYHGCRMACEDEKHGCCPDRITPAHGPNQEGCCLAAPYGCCPDNILPARGPNLEGCGCQYSPFGCCPDNKTTARGHGNEGCGCEHTTHGCCPDRYTPAAGPNYQGCACHTFQFGCCPDGVTIAKGPHRQGCGCRNTEFGCCSDDQTPAQGSNFAGCDCASSKFGCCPDGVTDSQGENFDDCPDVPVNRQESCKLDKDRGPCRNYTVKWFFDMQYGGCSRFWYGGCEGNANRFMSMNDCKNVCVEPEGKEVCELPKVTGACEGYFPSWYYDKERKQCAQFIWGGCLGNANRFETREECQSLCVVDQDIDACEQSKEEGPCKGQYRRWYFDKESQSCQEFIYGGCKANHNNFPTDSACKQQCLQPGRKKDLCALPRAQGNCTEREPLWYFDVSENRCMPFYYSGCDGNNNRFITRETCETDCPTDIEKDTCMLPALVGECHNYTERWYYDTKDRRCRQFYYGGCGGNDNNFRSEQACLQRCELQTTTALPEQEPFKAEYCFLPSEQGPCRTSIARWFYDSRDGVCKQFLYGGCQGNANSFETREECHQKCSAVQDLCSLPMVVGPCNADYLQWFYDKETDTCQEFNYGGCQGNDNRFSDQMSCERRCKKTPSVIATESPYVLTTRVPTFIDHRVTPSPSVHICYIAVNAGNCSENIAAWFYDAASQKCQAFIYTGCGGNANRFNSEEQCERQCGRFRGQDVCNYPHDTGPCRGYFTKWYYDFNSGRCHEFVYGGCEGNGNRFTSLEECESICVKREETPVARNDTVSHLANEIDVDAPPVKDTCEAYREECTSLLCPYGTEGFVDAEDCNRCRCYDPCRDTTCPEETVCAIDLNPNASQPHQTQFIPVCRPENKDGICPPLSSSHGCSHECRNDADCSGELKCCSTGCGTSCVIPVSAPPLAELITTDLPAFTDAPHILGAEPAMINEEETTSEISAEEGSFVTLKCIAFGNPIPSITWRKGDVLIENTLPRYRFLSAGTLQIFSLYHTDSGIYTCIAENGIGQPVRKDIKLDVTDPSPHPANVVGEDDTKVLVTLGAPYLLHCYAVGWPRPTVTWWKGESLVPFSSLAYEQNRYYSLLIRSVKLSNLGVYTCQAYNGLGKAASWSVTVRAVGPVYSTNPDDEQYKKFLVSAPDKPTTTSKPQAPYRPTRPQPVVRPPYRQPAATPQPYIPSPYTEPAPEIIPPEIPASTPRVFTVPIRTNISMSRTTFPVGGDISIPCDVDGYPIPNVQWYKNGAPLQSSDSVQISESHRLTILQANNTDSGEYLCKAENQYSQSSSSVTISVQGIYIHPNCTDNPFFANCGLIVQAQYCTHKYYARFCCRSCTQAGQLPSYGPHLNVDVRQPIRTSNLLNKK